jgi:O-antigen/teichoic acid export membrane protein
VFFIAGAKAYFIVAGFIIEVIALPNILGDATFGAYALVASMVSPVNNVLVTGTIQAVSRFTAQSRERVRAIQRAGLRMQLFVGLAIAAGFAALSPVFASFFHDSSKAGPLALAAAIIGLYSVYAVFVGTANGMRHFHKQAGLDVSSATLRGGAMIGMALAGFGVYGVVGGWVGAIAAVFVLSMFVVGLPGRAKPGEEPFQLKPMLSFFTSVMVFLVFFNLIIFVDGLLLKRFGAEWFMEHGFTAAQASDLADTQVGHYRVVQSLARLCYQLIIAATFVVFPLISRSTFDADHDVTRRYVRTTLRYALMFAGGVAVVFAANPHDLLALLYGEERAELGAFGLRALAPGYVAFSLFAIVCTILNGAGQTRDAIITAVVTLVAAVVANTIALQRADPGQDALFAAGAATGGAMLFGVLLSGWFVKRRLGAFMSPVAVLRVVVAAGAAIAVGHVFEAGGKMMTLVEAAVVGVVYLVALVATRELTRADLRAVLDLRKQK